jgi:hypothetical protein
LHFSDKRELFDRWQDKSAIETKIPGRDESEDVSDPLDDFNGDIDDVLNMLDEENTKKEISISKNNVLLNSGPAPKSWVSEQDSHKVTSLGGGLGTKLAPLPMPIVKAPPSMILLAPLVTPTTPVSFETVETMETVDRPATQVSGPTPEQAFEEEEIIEEFIPEDVESLASSDDNGFFKKTPAVKEADDGHAAHSDIGQGDTASSASSLSKPKRNHTRGSSMAFQEDNNSQDDASSDIVFSDDDLGDF